MRTCTKPPPPPPPKRKSVAMRQRIPNVSAHSIGRRKESEPDLVELAGTLQEETIEAFVRFAPQPIEQRPPRARTQLLERMFFLTMILLLGSTNAYSLFDRHRFGEVQSIDPAVDIDIPPPSVEVATPIEPEPPAPAAMPASAIGSDGTLARDEPARDEPARDEPARDDPAPDDERRMEEEVDPPIEGVDSPKPRPKARKSAKRHRYADEKRKPAAMPDPSSSSATRPVRTVDPFSQAPIVAQSSDE
jgi:hypothetical protein